jgi:hypothetical protein
MDPREKPKYPEAEDRRRTAPDDISPGGRRSREKPRHGPDGSPDPGSDTIPPTTPSRASDPVELETYERPADREGVETVRKTND